MPLLTQVDAEAYMVAAVRRVALPSMPKTFEPGFLWGEYLAAEADAARSLRVQLVPTKIFAGDPTVQELAAVTTPVPPVPYLVEAAYDFEPDMFRDDKWGMIQTRQKPIISVESVKMVFPVIAAPFIIPPDWVRFDKKYGQLRFVPTGPSMATPITMTLMQMIGGVRSVPHMVIIRYTAGLTDVATNWPDLLDTIKKMAVLRVIDGIFLPQSGSISADGLSESASVDMQKMHDVMDAKLEALREAIHGVRLMVM